MKRQRIPKPPQPVDPLDLDALKAAGLNGDAESRRLLDAHERRERAELERLLRSNLNDDKEDGSDA